MGPGEVLPPDVLAALVARLGILPARAGEVGRDRRPAVEVGLPVGDGRDPEQPARLLEDGEALDVATQQLVPRRVVALGPRDRDPVSLDVGQAEAETVSLDL